MIYLIQCIVSNEKEEKIILDFLEILMNLIDAGVLDGAQYMETQHIDTRLWGIDASKNGYLKVVKEFVNIRPITKLQFDFKKG